MNENQILLENTMIIAGILLIVIIFITIWLIPIFCSRKNENATAILLINLFLGWIPIIWIVLLLAALLGKKKNQ